MRGGGSASCFLPLLSIPVVCYICQAISLAATSRHPGLRWQAASRRRVPTCETEPSRPELLTAEVYGAAVKETVNIAEVDAKVWAERHRVSRKARHEIAVVPRRWPCHLFPAGHGVRSAGAGSTPGQGTSRRHVVSYRSRGTNELPLPRFRP